MKEFFGSVAGIIVLCAIVIGLFFLGFWVKNYSTNRNAQILQNTYGRQNALVEEINTKMIDANMAGIPAGQRIAIVNQICDDASKLSGSIPLSATAQRFILLECPQ